MRKLGFFLLFLGVGLAVYYSFRHVYTLKSVDDIEQLTNVREVISEADLHNTLGARINYEVGESVANLVIPKLNQSYEVYWGTDDDTLAKGVGMYVSEWTVTPDKEGHTVLSGHRDSVFRPLGDLESGDQIYVTYRGIDYEYIINKIWITDANDRTVIVEKDEATLTVTTCYPFYYIGSAPDRYIIQASLIQKGYLL